MKNNKAILSSVLILFFICCNKEDDINKINRLINSNNPDKVVKGYLLIGEKNETYFIKNIFQNLNDQRVSHNYKNIGVSVYQSKMIAIKEISGLKPPREITFERDDSIISFYYEWAFKNNYLNDKGDNVYNVPN